MASSVSVVAYHSESWFWVWSKIKVLQTQYVDGPQRQTAADARKCKCGQRGCTAYAGGQRLPEAWFVPPNAAQKAAHKKLSSDNLSAMPARDRAELVKNAHAYEVQLCDYKYATSTHPKEVLRRDPDVHKTRLLENWEEATTFVDIYVNSQPMVGDVAAMRKEVLGPAVKFAADIRDYDSGCFERALRNCRAVATSFAEHDLEGYLFKRKRSPVERLGRHPPISFDTWGDPTRTRLPAPRGSLWAAAASVGTCAFPKFAREVGARGGVEPVPGTLGASGAHILTAPSTPVRESFPCTQRRGFSRHGHIACLVVVKDDDYWRQRRRSLAATPCGAPPAARAADARRFAPCVHGFGRHGHIA